MEKKEKKKKKWLTKIAASGIRRQRKLLNMTQEELAVKLSVDPKTVSCIETCSTSVTFKNLEKLSEIFSCPVDTFFQDYESTDVPMIIETLESALESLEPEVQLGIITYMMTLADIKRKNMPKAVPIAGNDASRTCRPKP